MTVNGNKCLNVGGNNNDRLAGVLSQPFVTTPLGQNLLGFAFFLWKTVGIRKNRRFFSLEF